MSQHGLGTVHDAPVAVTAQDCRGALQPNTSESAAEPADVEGVGWVIMSIYVYI